jgi:hypothetical protein
MRVTRWTNGDEFIEIELATSVEKGSVLVVNSSRPLRDLPLEFREQARIGSHEETALRAAVESWAVRNGFVPTNSA